jgi:flagellar hook assembly protein FlgD
LGLADAAGAGLPQLYPNPVDLSSPDVNVQRLHFDQVEAGSSADIFNIVGERVITLHLKGDYHQDYWDCVNANGAQVATGIYIVRILQPSGKKSVQRAAILRLN